ncbi:MAG: hypothetical protein JEY99_19955 [Spirochaetales bacterium]|nr:hypothetical protein [Spirochaetales bacterium]
MNAVAPPGGKYDLFRRIEELPLETLNYLAIRMAIGIGGQSYGTEQGSS